jgi:hypothetical protein
MALERQKIRGIPYDKGQQKFNFLCKPRSDVCLSLSAQGSKQKEKKLVRERESKPARASFNPVSISGILGTNTPGVSKTYMLG